ncbi:MAG: FAD-binding oxidoreductase [Chromatiales bacterium]|nr:FAD-binding oxidoreductase [Chromatiales bacterium]
MAIIGDSVEQHLAIARGTPAERFIEPVDYTYAYRDRPAFLKDALAWRIRREHGFDFTEVQEQQLRSLEPSLGPDTTFAVQLPGHAWIRDPGAYVTALCDHACSLGVKLRIAGVKRITRSESGVQGVETDNGFIACETLVVAAGVWSKELLAGLDVRISMESERGYHLELVDAEGGPRMPIGLAAYKFIATPMEGRLRLAGLVEFGGLEAPPSEAPYQLLLRQARAAFPSLKWNEERRWLGHRPATDDSIPVIGEIEGVPGVYAAFGHQHVGLTGGPKTGRIVADLISGRRPNFDLRPYSPGRF